MKAVINLDIIGSPTGSNGDTLRQSDACIFGRAQYIRLHVNWPALSEFVARYFCTRYVRQSWKMTIDRTQDDGATIRPLVMLDFPRFALIEQSDEVNRAHTARDTLEDIENDYIRKTTQVALATLVVLADGPDAPAEVRLDPATWRLEWLPSRGATLLCRRLATCPDSLSLRFADGRRCHRLELG